MRKGLFVVFKGETLEEAIENHFESGYRDHMHAQSVTESWEKPGTEYKIIDTSFVDDIGKVIEPTEWLTVPKKEK